MFDDILNMREVNNNNSHFFGKMMLWVDSKKESRKGDIRENINVDYPVSVD